MGVMREALYWDKLASPRSVLINEAGHIANVLRFRLRSSSAAYRVLFNPENIEELFSLASAISPSELHYTGSLAESIPWAIAATLDYAKKNNPSSHVISGAKSLSPEPISLPHGWTRIPDQPQYKIELYQFLAGLMAGHWNAGQGQNGIRNTIITFNYDTLIEDALKALGINFSYGFYSHNATFRSTSVIPEDGASEDTLRLLKLHGSVNWVFSGSPDPTDLNLCDDYADVLGETNNPRLFIQPPTWHKGFKNPLARVWDCAIDRIGTASSVMIMGYSIPETDQHFRYFLAAGLQDNISLRRIVFVNDKAEELKERLFSFMRKELEDDGIIKVVPQKIWDFFYDADQRKDINRFFPVDFENSNRYLLQPEAQEA